MREPIDYVKSDERVPRGERRPDDSMYLIGLFIFGLAGVLVGWMACYLWMTI